jgi:hypothetical protein
VGVDFVGLADYVAWVRQASISSHRITDFSTGVPATADGGDLHCAVFDQISDLLSIDDR